MKCSHPCLAVQLGIFATLSLVFAPPISAQQHPSELPTPQPVVFNPAQPNVVVLENGLSLYLLEDHELPLFNATAYIKTGSIYEPAGKTGLASLTGQVMRSGGTTQRPGDTLDEELAFIAGSVEVSIGQSSATASVSMLTKHIDTGLEIFADVLMNPAFPQDKVELAKKRAIARIRRQNDHPGSISFREFMKQVYGPDSPWGRSSTIETVGTVSREDMAAFHAQYFHPNNTLLAIAGDFKTDELIAKIRKVFQNWEKTTVDFPELPAFGNGPRPGVYHIEKDVNQSAIYIGHFGINDLNPDWYAVRVMNRIFGVGTFTSRMGKEVRVNRGLAYSVGGAVTRSAAQGIFYLNCQTKAETTVEAITTMLDVTRKMREDPVLDDEFNLSKNRLINSDIFNYTSSSAIVNQKVYYRYYNFADDYLETFVEKTQAVTKDDVLRVASAYMHPDQVAIVVVGKSEAFDKPLSTLGPVTRIDLSAANEKTTE